LKAESAKFVDQANIMLERARIMLTVNLNEDAARAAYLACFHVAQAYIFERTDRIAKTHQGVQSEFFRLSHADARVDQELRRFLSRSYEFKSVADYFSGVDPVVMPEEAANAVDTAKAFVGHIGALVEPRHD
jgi:uncharacterized protein (UPF0332 family)